MSKTQDIVIRIDSVGTVHGLHYDNFDLGFLGPKKIDRASEILFDEDAQSFHVALPGLYTESKLPHMSGFLKYDHARSFEVYLLENAAFNNIEVGPKKEFSDFAKDCRHRWNYGHRNLFKWEGSECSTTD